MTDKTIKGVWGEMNKASTSYSSIRTLNFEYISDLQLDPERT